MYTAVFVVIDTSDYSTTSDTYTIRNDYELQIRIAAWLNGNKHSKRYKFRAVVYKERDLEGTIY